MKNTIRYKNFLGTVEYSSEDNRLFGKIIGIEDMVVFDGSSVAEIQQNFENAVEEYLEYCKRYNRAPVRTYKGSFNVRIAPELHRSAALYAKSKGQSLNSLVEEAIRQYMWRELSSAEVQGFSSLNAQQQDR